MGTTAATAVGFTEARDSFSALTRQANTTGEAFTVLKHGKPWVEVRPLATDREPAKPADHRYVPVDLDELFAGYTGDFKAVEDGFAKPVGREAM